jgi:hypothetical protein
MTLVIGAVVLIAGARVRRIERAPALAVLAAAGAIAAIASLAAAGPGEDVIASRYRPMRALESRLDGLVPSGTTVLVSRSRSGAFDTQFDYEMGAVYALRREGVRVVTGESAALGAAYRPDGTKPDYVLRVRREGTPAAARAQVLARIPLQPGKPAAVLVSLTRLR